jgi:hypothetical protein
MDRVLVIHGPGVRSGYILVEARLIDLTSTIPAVLNVPIPTDMDGGVLTDFTWDFRAGMRICYKAPQPELEHKAADLSEQEESEILERLRGLGYVG